MSRPSSNDPIARSNYDLAWDAVEKFGYPLVFRKVGSSREYSAASGDDISKMLRQNTTTALEHVAQPATVQ